MQAFFGYPIDVMMVSEKLAYPEVLDALDLADTSICREVNASIYRRVEFEKQASEEGGFLSRVLEGPRHGPESWFGLNAWP